MSYDTAVIPPVRAGKVQSSIDFDYSGHEDGESFSAHGSHEWTFDSRTYYKQTGLDIGGDYPYVRQENGHTLEVHTDYEWMASEIHDTPNYTLSIERYGVSHRRGAPNCYYVQNGYYRLDEDFTIVSQSNERAPYVVRESNNDTKVFSPHPLVGESFDSGETAVRAIHSGTVGPSVLGRLHDVLVYDSPEDAIIADTYLSRHDEQGNPTEAPADD
jgi:hypothetical protein